MPYVNTFLRIIKRSALLASSLALCALTGGAAHALCPFAAEAQTAVGAQAHTDGQLLLRHALATAAGAGGAGGLAGQGSNDEALLRSATRRPFDPNNSFGNAALASAVRSFITQNKDALDVDGDTAFTPIDAQLIVRYLLGFRGEALAGNLSIAASAIRRSGSSVQQFIEGGCTTDQAVIAWNAFAKALLAGDATAAKAQLTGTALEVYGAAIDALLPQMLTMIASFGQPMVIERDVDMVQLALARRDGVDAVSSTSARTIHFVVLVRSPEGVWLIEAL
jgi:hypothetical protein